MPNRAAAALVTLLFSGCSLITQGTYQKVEVTSEPDGATFKVAGQEHHTKTTVNLPKEEITLTFSMPGYEDASYKLGLRTCSSFYWSCALGFITAGIDYFSGAWREFETDKVHVKLKPKPGTSVEREVQVRTSPEGATIEVDGVSYGRSNARFKLTWPPPSGSKEVALRLEGYEEMRVALRWESPVIDVKLVPKPKSVVAKFDSDPKGAEVWVDGSLVGRTPWTEKYDWHEGTPAKGVEFRLSGYVTETRKLTRDASVVSATLKEAIESVPLKLECNPPGAYLEIDGVPAGEAPAELRLDWSVKKVKHHTLKFIRAGYRSEEVRVEESQKRAPVTVRLQPLIPRLP